MEETSVYRLKLPTITPIPIVVSVPHCGIDFPSEVASTYDQELIVKPEDTDWFVERLYDFVPQMGIHLLTARYSRYVIDLNRSPDGQPLYNDGRVITGLVPSHTFKEEVLHSSGYPNQEEVERRKEAYYWPYHKRLERLLLELRERFEQVLLWEAHSILRVVKSIRESPFPDLILGDADGKSAGRALSNEVLKHLSNFELQHNHPFKGGYITRHFGKPNKKIHALQLEMTKDLYMDEKKTVYLPNKAKGIRKALQQTFQSLSKILEQK